MEIIKPEIEGLLILRPRIFTDARGYFFESYSKKCFDEAVGYPVEFVQDNQSKSSYGVVRGLHFQRPPFAQAKLVRCIKGKVLDVAVDLRRDSPTFGQHVAVEAVFQYKCDNYYAPHADGGISLNDETLGIDWKIAPADMILSEKDSAHPMLSEIISPF